MDYVLSLDVGTTTVRAFVYDNQCQIKAHQSDKVSFYFLFSKVSDCKKIFKSLGTPDSSEAWMG